MIIKKIFKKNRNLRIIGVASWFFIPLHMNALVINELFLNAKNSYHNNRYYQWIEVYNETAYPEDLTEYLICDGMDGQMAVTPIASSPFFENRTNFFRNCASNNLITNRETIPPGAFALILTPEYGLNESETSVIALTTPGTYLFTVSNTRSNESTSLEAGGPYLYYDVHGTENLPPDPVFLYKKDGTNHILQDHYGTADDPYDRIPFAVPSGKSIERIFTSRKGEKENWGISIREPYQTPGNTNGLYGYYADDTPTHLALNFQSSKKIRAGNIMPVEIFALTKSGKISYGFNSLISIRFNENFSFTETHNIVYKNKKNKMMLLCLLSGRSGEFGIKSVYSGTFPVFLDNETTKESVDTITFDPYKDRKKQQMVFSEILFRTKEIISGDKTYKNAQYIELVNISKKSLNLTNFYLIKHSFKKETQYSIPPTVLPPDAYLLLVSDLTTFNIFFDSYIKRNNTVVIKEVPFSLSQEEHLTIESGSGEIYDAVIFKESLLSGEPRGIIKNNKYTEEENTFFCALERKNLFENSFNPGNWFQSGRAMGQVIYKDVKLKRTLIITNTVTNYKITHGCFTNIEQNITDYGYKLTNDLTNFYTVDATGTPGYENSYALSNQKTFKIQVDRSHYVFDLLNPKPFFLPYTVSHPALITAEIIDKNGTVIKIISEGVSAFTEQINHIPFDGKAADQFLRRGLYFLKIKGSRTDNGSQDKIMIPFAVKKQE